MAVTVYYETDHTLALLGLRDETGTAVTGATVTVDLMTSKFTLAEATPFPLTMTDAGGGKYTAHIGSDHGLVLDTPYKLQITVDHNGTQRVFYSDVSVSRSKL